MVKRVTLRTRRTKAKNSFSHHFKTLAVFQQFTPRRTNLNITILLLTTGRRTNLNIHICVLTHRCAISTSLKSRIPRQKNSCKEKGRSLYVSQGSLGYYTQQRTFLRVG